MDEQAIDKLYKSSVDPETIDLHGNPYNEGRDSASAKRVSRISPLRRVFKHLDEEGVSAEDETARQIAIAKRNKELFDSCY